MKTISFSLFLVLVFCVAGASSAATVTVSMVDFSFNPSTVNINVGDTVMWVNNGTVQHTSTSGTSCTADGKWNSGALNPGQTFQHVFSTAGTFPFFCSFHCLSNNMVGTVVVSGSAMQAPVIDSFTATPASIVMGQSSTLAWTLSGGAPDTLTIDQGVGSVLGTTSKVVSPTTTTTFTLTASNSAGMVTKSVTVTVTSSCTVAAPVINSFTATPASIASGQSSTLAWTLSGGAPDTLTIDQGVGSVLGTNSKVVSPTTTTTFTLTATNCAGTVTKTVTVTVSSNVATFSGPVSLSVKKTSVATDSSGNQKLKSSTETVSGTLSLSVSETGPAKNNHGCFVEFVGSDGTDICIDDVSALFAESEKSMNEAALIIGTGTLMAQVQGTQAMGVAYIDAKATAKEDKSDNIISISFSGKFAGGIDADFVFSVTFRATLMPAP